MEWLDSILAGLGLTLKTIIAGAAGSFISLRFFEGLGILEKWSTFFGGALLAGYLTQPVMEFMEIKSQSVGPGVSLMIGLFGMSLAAAVIRTLKSTDWSAFIPKGK